MGRIGRDDGLGGELRIVKDIGMGREGRRTEGKGEYSIRYNNSICICILYNSIRYNNINNINTTRQHQLKPKHKPEHNPIQIQEHILIKLHHSTFPSDKTCGVRFLWNINKDIQMPTRIL